MTEESKSIFNNLRYILNAPIVNIFVVFGIVLIGLSFFSFSKTNGIISSTIPHWIMFGIGCGLVTFGLIIFLLTGEAIRINKRVNLKKGLRIKLGSISVNLRVGRIEEISGMDKTAAVVLPANTTFVDDCITDKNSALGAYMLEHYPDRIEEIKKSITETLQASGTSKSNDNTYPAGTTIILPSPYDQPVRILVTGATVRKESSGIKAEPSTICACIQNTFKKTSDKKISEIRMPILGSGHGGLEINSALLFLLLSIRYNARYYYHIKSIEILVTENGEKSLKDIYRLQYLILLGKVKNDSISLYK